MSIVYFSTSVVSLQFLEISEVTQEFIHIFSLDNLRFDSWFYPKDGKVDPGGGGGAVLNWTEKTGFRWPGSRVFKDAGRSFVLLFLIKVLVFSGAFFLLFIILYQYQYHIYIYILAYFILYLFFFQKYQLI